jgi:hypothetical protein
MKFISNISLSIEPTRIVESARSDASSRFKEKLGSHSDIMLRFYHKIKVNDI